MSHARKADLAGKGVRVGSVSLGLVDQLLGVWQGAQGLLQALLDVTGTGHLHHAVLAAYISCCRQHAQEGTLQGVCSSALAKPNEKTYCHMLVSDHHTPSNNLMYVAAGLLASEHVGFVEGLGCDPGEQPISF